MCFGRIQVRIRTHSETGKVGYGAYQCKPEYEP